MFLKKNLNRMVLALVLSVLCGLQLIPSAQAQVDFVGTERASWLLQRQGLEAMALTGERFEQDEIGGGGASTYTEVSKPDKDRKGPKIGWAILASTILPGTGEAMMGHTRGYFMMALDIFSWTQVAKYHNDGEDYTDSYYAYADEHYTDEMLVEGYNAASTDPERSGEGAQYFPGIGNITSVDDLDQLPLYVSPEEDRREYYENLGKWDQFIFGWDDYLRPSFWGPTYGYEADGTIIDLRQPWVSEHREAYRTLRDQANDAYEDRDQWLYLNIGLRIFSIFQVAYLGGMLSGDDSSEMEVAGHPVGLIAEPRGINSGTLGARVSF